MLKKVLVVDAAHAPWIKYWTEGFGGRVSMLIASSLQEASDLLLGNHDFAAVAVAARVGGDAPNGLDFACKARAIFHGPVLLMSHEPDYRQRFKNDCGTYCCDRLDLPETITSLIAR